jgi:hypothetical protein
MGAFGAFPPSAASRARARGAAGGVSRPLRRMSPPPGIHWQSSGARTGSLPCGLNRVGGGRFHLPSTAALGRAWQKGRALTWLFSGTIRPAGTGSQDRWIRGNCAGWLKPASSGTTRWCVRAMVTAGYALSRSGVYSSHPSPRLRLARLRRGLRQLCPFPPTKKVRNIYFPELA